MGHDKCPALRNSTVLPLMLSPERDEQLTQMTEHRVTTFAHDLVPDYLRTKLEPSAETKMLQLEHKAQNLQYDNAQVNINNVISKFYLVFNTSDSDSQPLYSGILMCVILEVCTPI